MDTMKLILSTLGAFGAMFVLAGLFNMAIAADFMRSNFEPGMVRHPPNMVLILLGYLVLAFIMAILYPLFSGTYRSLLMHGLRFGMIMGLVWMFPFSLVLHGAYNFPSAAIFIDTGWALIEQGIGGIVISLIYGRGSQT
jgi:hypothetical protein